MRTKSLSSEKMEARVARFNKLQTYQQQNFEAHGIPGGGKDNGATCLSGDGAGGLSGTQRRRAGQRPAWPDRQHRGVRAG